jgi:hypothetical protein
MRWKGRDALSLGNGRLQAVILACGGHIAELCLLDREGASMNLLWESPWETADPGTSDARRLSEAYGGMPAGPFLAGFTGHALCLDLFGPPSPEEAERGISLHGEASMQTWKLDETDAGCVTQAVLKHSEMHMLRTLTFADNDSAVLVEEVLENRSDTAREVHWVQHVSLGAPLLEEGNCSIAAAVDQCKVWPLGYEGREALRADGEFIWPWAPAAGGGMRDLRVPFQESGRGFVAAARVAEGGGFAYIAALNPALGLALVYCFRREDFPWVAIWEENCAREEAPWNGTTRVLGMEFGTTPMPLGRDAIRALGPLYNTQVVRVLPAGGHCSAKYAVCAARVPKTWRAIEGIRVTEQGMEIVGAERPECIRISAAGLDEFLSKDRK